MKYVRHFGTQKMKAKNVCHTVTHFKWQQQCLILATSSKWHFDVARLLQIWLRSLQFAKSFFFSLYDMQLCWLSHLLLYSTLCPTGDLHLPPSLSLLAIALPKYPFSWCLFKNSVCRRGLQYKKASFDIFSVSPKLHAILFVGIWKNSTTLLFWKNEDETGC